MKIEKIIGSITKSKRIFDSEEPAVGKIVFPNMALIREKTLEQITNLYITKVEWNSELSSIGFTLSDGQTCKVGENDFT